MKLEKLLYLLLFFPTLTEFLESGHLPIMPRELITDFILTLCIGLFVWLLHRRHNELIHLSETDSLTEVWNRRRFDIDLNREIIRAHRMHTQLVMAFIDVDNFKSINDQKGHHTGDLVLKNIGKILKAGVRDQVDRCYRTGGDEFAIIFPETTKKGVKGAIKRIELIRTEAFDLLNSENSGLSIGIVVLSGDETDRDFINRADKLMYKEKMNKHKVTGLV